VSRAFPYEVNEIRAARISFSHLRRAKNGPKAKRLQEGVGVGERRERLPANPSILKSSFAYERGS